MLAYSMAEAQYFNTYIVEISLRFLYHNVLPTYILFPTKWLPPCYAAWSWGTNGSSPWPPVLPNQIVPGDHSSRSARNLEVACCRRRLVARGCGKQAQEMLTRASYWLRPQTFTWTGASAAISPIHSTCELSYVLHYVCNTFKMQSCAHLNFLFCSGWNLQTSVGLSLDNEDSPLACQADLMELHVSGMLQGCTLSRLKEPRRVW